MGIVVVFLALCYLLILKLSDSPFGRNLKIIREDDDLPLALGKPVFYLRVKAMAIGAMLAAVSGSLYAHYITYISPLDFMPTVTFIIWGMVIIGGKGNAMGSVLGAVIIVIFYNSTRYVKDYLFISSQTAASLRMVVIGMLMLLVVLYKPKGLLKEKKKVYKLKEK
jgi:branched-chain amino acid transport system permease protein